MSKFHILLASVLCTAAMACAQKPDSKPQAETPAADTSPAATQGNVKKITQADFARLVADYTANEWKFLAERPAIVDFNATWCGPCRRLAPILDELAEQYKGQIDFYAIDVDENPDIAQAFQVRSIPLVLFCPVEGQPQAVTGLYPKEELVKVIDYIIYHKKQEQE